jgi:hypothetical protein
MTAEFCPRCGTARLAGGRFCSSCGRPFEVAPGPVWGAPGPKVRTDTPLGRLPSWLVAVLAVIAIAVAVLLYGGIPRL